MRIPRSNPWPALADLFVALLISTFGGLVLIGTAVSPQSGTAADKNELTAALTASVRDLKEKNSETEAKVKFMSDELSKCEEGRRHLAAWLEVQQTMLAKVSGGKGLDLPPCLAREGRPLPLVEITVSEDNIEVRKLPQPGYEQMMSTITGLQTLTAAGRIGDKEFRDLAGPIASWGRGSPIIH